MTMSDALRKLDDLIRTLEETGEIPQAIVVPACPCSGCLWVEDED